jgi:hypothetical protein
MPQSNIVKGIKVRRPTKISSLNAFNALSEKSYNSLTDKPSILVFDGLSKITVGITQPSDPSIGDLWVDAS